MYNSKWYVLVLDWKQFLEWWIIIYCGCSNSQTMYSDFQTCGTNVMSSFYSKVLLLCTISKVRHKVTSEDEWRIDLGNACM